MSLNEAGAPVRVGSGASVTSTCNGNRVHATDGTGSNCLPSVKSSTWPKALNRKCVGKIEGQRFSDRGVGSP
jgi:hypothetical protein